jgi:predicted nucleic acid-binding protein
MARLFFDTSALVKRYYEESGTAVVDDLVEDPDHEVVITSLSIIETVSAFRRKQNRDDLDADRVSTLLSGFFEEALSEFVVLPMDESYHQFSFDLVLEVDLRTLDSLQLSAALSTVTESSAPTSVSADVDLLAVAADRGLETLNPDEEQVD